MQSAFEEKTREVVADVFGMPLNEVTLETGAESVGNWDSLNIINLLVALEAEFDVELTIDDAAELQSVQAIVTKLEQKS